MCAMWALQKRSAQRQQQANLFSKSNLMYKRCLNMISMWALTIVCQFKLFNLFNSEYQQFYTLMKYSRRPCIYTLIQSKNITHITHYLRDTQTRPKVNLIVTYIRALSF